MHKIELHFDEDVCTFLDSLASEINKSLVRIRASYNGNSRGSIVLVSILKTIGIIGDIAFRYPLDSGIIQMFIEDGQKCAPDRWDENPPNIHEIDIWQGDVVEKIIEILRNVDRRIE